MASIKPSTINLRRRTRKVPMQVLALGLSRTGTDSLQKALLILGFGDCYHGWKLAFERVDDCVVFNDFLEAKYRGNGPTPTKEDWDSLLHDCRAVSDMPCASFAEELIATYPDAKIILTSRDVDTWHNSVKSALLQPMLSPAAAIIDYFAVSLQSKRAHCRSTFIKAFSYPFDGSFEKHGKRIFHEHNARVRALAPRDKLLEYRVTEGWVPLCDFLGVEVPDVEFPNGNAIAAARAKFRGMWREEVRKIGKMAAPWVGGMTMLGIAFFLWYRNSGGVA